MREASIARKMAGTSRQMVDQVLAADVTDAFGRALIAAAKVRSAIAVVDTARADRELAGNRRNAGRVTDADVLQLDVYLARARAAHVEAIAEERVARARLNQLMGDPLDAAYALDPEAAAAGIDLRDPAALQTAALKNRPEVALAQEQEQRAAAAVATAQAVFAPKLSIQGSWALDGAKWSERSSSWSVGAVARINLFNGLADKARLAEARYALTRHAFEKDNAESMARLEVLVAIARLEAARAQEQVGRAAAEQARASHRIVRDRYASGLADVAALLRSADAVDQAVQQQTVARVSVLVAAANLKRAIGTL
jgi:outer membrane protein TolC